METKTRKRLPNKVRRRRARREAKEAAVERNEVKAVGKYLKVSPRKTRLILDELRGKKVDEALDILRFSPQKAAGFIYKVLESARANAENNFELDGEELFIHQAYADEGPVIKRWRPRAMGRATPIRKKTSHITIVVKQRGEDR